MKYQAIRDGINAAQEKAKPLQVDLETTKLICFSDHHRGSGDGADDFRPCEQTYLNALQYYLERDYLLIVLGDVEELWESEPKDIVKQYASVYEMESKFYRTQNLLRVWGNHDDLWRFPDAVKTFFGKKFPGIGCLESINMQFTHQNEPIGNILWLHGHQGTLLSARFAAISKFFVRLFWRPIQRIFHIPLSTARNTPKLRYKTDKAMNLWASIRSRQLIICGHTHQYLFGSLAGETDKKPCYFNTGACSYGNGNISGIEISNKKIRLVEWEPDSSEPYYIAADFLTDIFDRCE